MATFTADSIPVTMACALPVLLGISLNSPASAQLTPRYEQDLLLLQSLAASALQSNPSVLSSYSDSQSSERSRQAAWHQFLPTPSISADKADQPSRTALNQKTVILRLQQPLWQGGRLTAALDQAEAAARGSYYSWLGQAQLTLEQLIQTLARHQQLRYRADYLARSVNTHQRLLAQVKRRVSEGLSPPSDLTVAESRLLNVRAELAAAQSDMQQQELQLQRLLARRLDSAELRALNQLDMYSAHSLSVVERSEDRMAQTASQQPRVLKLEADGQQISHRIRILQANRLPQLSLRLDRIQGDVTGVDHTAVLSLNTTWGAGLSNQREIEALELRSQSLELDRQAEWQEAQRRLTSLQLDINLQNQRHQQLQLAQQRAESFLESTERLYLTGRKAWLEVLNAAREVTASQTAASDALLQIWNNTQLLRLIENGPLQFAAVTIQPDATRQTPMPDMADNTDTAASSLPSVKAPTEMDSDNDSPQEETRHAAQ